MTQEIINRTTQFVREKMSADTTGHDWHHVYRVWQTAIQLAEEEGGDQFVIELAALLHDIADWKFADGDEKAGPKAAAEWLQSINVGATVIRQVCDIIGALSFKGAGVATPMKTIEGKIVQDADRLDAIGAIGIARAFAYGGHKGSPLYDPDSKPEAHESFDAYKNNRSSTINHFYEKLLLLKDRINTDAAKKLANERHQFMEEFLAQFFREYNKI